MRSEIAGWHFGVLAAAGTGHLNPMIALSQELAARGHRVTFFGRPKSETLVPQAGFDFVAVARKATGKEDIPAPLGILAEISLLRSRLRRMCAEVKMYLDELPRAIAEADVNVLLVDEIALAGPTVAQLLDVPYFIVTTSVPHRFGWQSASWLTGYRNSKSPLAWLQRFFLELSVFRMHGPVRRTVDHFRAAAGLGPVRGIPDEYPCLADIAQLPQCLDLPRRRTPQDFRYAGPFVKRAAQAHVTFPWERLDGTPLIYASLGTTSCVRPEIIRMIAAACDGLDTQLVISLGNRFATEEFDGLPGKPLVARYAPQPELLRHADLVITNGGLNTVFETLREGKPMIAIPLAYDQPAVATRLKRLGAAEVLPATRLSPARIRRAIRKVLADSRYADAAKRIQSELCAIDGAGRAATIMENALEPYRLTNKYWRACDGSERAAAASGIHGRNHTSRASESSSSTAPVRSQ